ncbi:hypothetical protein LCGC14_0470520 [marine sediment metagenome]|uniref:DUF2800 domain-containing protein n=1 Tax=marine sediment metagenome TaxID=412755 RepID=A0A0F9VL40_9ZZZZ
MSDHALLSPSSRHRWSQCPGSVKEEAKYPAEESNPAAIDGTHSHTLLEHCIKDGLSDPTTKVIQKMTDHEGEFTVDMERAIRVKVAIDYIKARVEEYNGLCTVFSEQKVTPRFLVHRGDMHGTLDVQIIGGDIIEIIDYKDGFVGVEVIDNPAIEQYALGVVSGYAEKEEPVPVKTFRMTIIQPKLALTGGEVITSHEVSVDYIIGLITPIGDEADATDADDAPLVAGSVQCKWCCATGCVERASQAMADMDFQFPVVAPGDDVTQQVVSRDASVMTNLQIVQIIEAAPLMRQLLESVDKEALRRMTAGQDMPGVKVVNGRGSRKWALSEEDMLPKLTKMGIPKAVLLPASFVSPAQAEKLTWEKRDGTPMQVSEKQLKRLNDEYIVHMAGKPTVAFESDSRVAVVTNAAPMFDAVETPVIVATPDWLT